MTRHAAARLLAKGEPLTLDILATAAPQRWTAKADPTRVYLTSRAQWCHDGAAEGVPYIETGETVVFDAANVEPKPGQIALCAYYDGWSYTVGAVLVGRMDEGAEGGGSAGGVERFRPLSRFRVLGVATFHRYTRGDGIELTRADGDGLDFEAHREQYRRERQARPYETTEAAAFLLSLPTDQAAPLSLVLTALDAAYLPNVPRPRGTFVAGLSAESVPGASEVTRQFTRLYFPCEDGPPIVQGRLSLVAFEHEAQARVDVAAMVEQAGELCANVAGVGTLRPPEYRALRACVGGENPEGLSL